LLLLGRAERDQRGPEEALPDDPDPGGGLGAGVLLVEDHLLVERGAPAAVLPRPAHARPPGSAKRALPREPFVERLVLVARTAATAQRRELSGQMIVEPLADLGPKGLVLGGEAQVHGAVIVRQ
jgi:hypothetical protein